MKASGPETTSFSGEALLWESVPGGSGDGMTELGDTVCVDVGLTREMGEEVAKRAPAVLVLTHDDADHIGGYRGFAATGLSSLRELWVPFDWGALAFTLAQPTVLDANAPPVALLEGEVISRLVRARALNEEEAVFAVDELRNILARTSAQALEAIEILQRDAGLVELLGRILNSDGSYPSQHRHIPDRTAADRALNRARVLMEILSSASRAGVKVRFFSVDYVTDRRRSWEFAGTPGLATMLNAVEIGTPRHWEEGSIQFVGGLLALSIQNRRALCTLLWHNGAIDGGAIVWSDSSGEWLDSHDEFEPIYRVSISTAPHHASENSSHDRIWDVMRPRLKGLLLLCAGGHQSQKGVRPEFGRHPECRRRCTRCRHVRLPSRHAADVVAVVKHRRARFLSPVCAR